MQSYAVKAYEALQLSGYGRMDFMMDEQGGCTALRQTRFLA